MTDIAEICLYFNRGGLGNEIVQIGGTNLLSKKLGYRRTMISGVSANFLFGEHIGLKLQTAGVESCVVRTANEKEQIKPIISESLEKFVKGIKRVCGDDYDVKINSRRYNVI